MHPRDILVISDLIDCFCMKKFTLLFGLLIVSMRAMAHLGGISGVVYDQSTRLPLKDVTVQLSGTGKAAMTNELGQYRFEDLIPAKYKIELSHVSFRTRVLEVSVASDETTFLKTELTGANVELSEVTVSTQRAHDQQLISNLDIRLRLITNSQ